MSAPFCPTPFSPSASDVTLLKCIFCYFLCHKQYLYAPMLVESCLCELVHHLSMFDYVCVSGDQGGKVGTSLLFLLLVLPPLYKKSELYPISPCLTMYVYQGPRRDGWYQSLCFLPLFYLLKKDRTELDIISPCVHYVYVPGN